MKYKKLLILIILIAGILLFYWFQIRPTQIKHDCSWVKKHTDAIRARVGLTEAELRAEGKLKNCLAVPTPSTFEESRNQFINLEGTWCISHNQEIIDQNKPQKYVPAKDWYEKASSQEYQFCLHDKGL